MALYPQKRVKVSDIHGLADSTVGNKSTYSLQSFEADSAFSDCSS